MVSRIIPVETFDLVIFGGTGDLARRKILPGLFRRFCAGQIPDSARIMGAARTDTDAVGYRKIIADSIREFAGNKWADSSYLPAFLDMIFYIPVDARGDGGWQELADWMRPDVIHTHYFSVGPSLFGDLAERLNRFGIAQKNTRIVVEKPFGHDLASAKALNASLASQFDESQIYRIDHYLGKETVQNLMAVRFGNLLFEPLWNAQYIDSIQITVAETVGIGGRGAYYDKSGAMRDMVQNHLMQLLCLIAMEPPAKFDPDAVRDEKLKVIRALKDVDADDVVRGQYAASDDEPSYHQDVEDTNSKTESYIALKAGIENWRWAGVPFYLRTGKKLKARTSEIAIIYKKLPHSIFTDTNGQDAQNVLAIQLQPNEGMTLDVTIKEPGLGGMRLIHVPLDMTFDETFGNSAERAPDAYERLIMDVIRGNQTLFMRGDEVEAAWSWADPIIDAWKNAGDKPKAYDVGSDGPIEAHALLHRENRKWREVKE